jgi:membrane protease YdiL (CAAX protease family)
MPPVDESRFNPLAGNLPLLLLYVILAWTTIGICEEMFYRAFLINRLSEVFQNSNARLALALIGSSVVFGLIHAVEGPLGILNAAAFGLVLGTVYLRTGRDLWVTIIAHALANTLRFVLLYLGVV